MYKNNVRKSVKKLAKKSIKSNLVLAFLVLLLAIICSGLLVYVVARLLGYGYNINLINYLLVGLILTIVSPVVLGFSKVSLNISNGKEANYQEMFNCFKNTKFIKLYSLVILTLILVYWLIGLIPVAGIFINLIILLLFIPYIILLPFVYLTYPELKNKEIMSKTLDIISGNRISFYGLIISFSFWFILSILTCGILLFYVFPYVYLSLSNFYLYVTHEKEIKKEKAIGDGNLILIFIGVLVFLILFLIVNVPASTTWFMRIMNGEVSDVGDATLSYGGIEVTYDSPADYQTSASTNSSKTYVNNDNYNILQYSIYLSSVNDSKEMDKEIVQEMKDSGDYKNVTDSEFTVTIDGKEIEGYRYDAEEISGDETSSIIVYYPKEDFTITISLTNSTGNKLDVEDIKEFVTIY